MKPINMRHPKKRCTTRATLLISACLICTNTLASSPSNTALHSNSQAAAHAAPHAAAHAAAPANKGNAVTEKSVAQHYAAIAHSVFEDALITAKTLKNKIIHLIEQPSPSTLEAARAAWKSARAPYLQSEVFRFGNAIVDDWEGQLNAWPLDEGLIDYVEPNYAHELGNPGATANIIANPKLVIGDKTIDLSDINPTQLANLNELAGSEANVATGYHAIEFLLWGQDLNGTQGGAGDRPYTDFVQGQGCTHGNCDRRAAYLLAVTDLLISDLTEMVSQWAPDQAHNYYAEFIALPENIALKRILYGMGSLSLGELAGERMKVALEANSPEDEQDCFSDNTHYAHYYNAKGVQNIYLGVYRRVNGKTLIGPSLEKLMEDRDKLLNEKMKSALADTETQLQKMVTAAEQDNAMRFDQMISPGNTVGDAIIRAAITSLVTQTALIEKVAHTIGIKNLNSDTADHTFN